MAPTDRIEKIATAIGTILNATGEFNSGTPHYPVALGKLPAYSVAWETVTQSYPDRTLHPSTIEATHMFTVEVYLPYGEDIADMQRRLWRFVGICRQAIVDNPRLNNTCRRARFVSATPELGKAHGQEIVILSCTVEADIAGEW